MTKLEKILIMLCVVMGGSLIWLLSIIFTKSTQIHDQSTLIESLQASNKDIRAAKDSLSDKVILLEEKGLQIASERAKHDTIYLTRYESIHEIDSSALPDSGHAVLERFINSRHIAHPR